MITQTVSIIFQIPKELFNNCLALPLHTRMSENDVELVVSHIKKAGNAGIVKKYAKKSNSR